MVAMGCVKTNEKEERREKNIHYSFGLFCLTDVV